jgi:peptidoglycan/LPS O-acetylase OafA/YrhL
LIFKANQVNSTQRVAGLDQLRFILALSVLLSHCGLLPDLSGQPRVSLIDLGSRALVDNLVNPVAAVIVFFLISGFCIHLPYRDRSRIDLLPYFTRRFVRILIPVAAAFVMAIPLKLEFSLFSDSILWSLVCEEVYYLLYPTLRKLSRRFSWAHLFGFSFVLALILGLVSLRTNSITGGIYPAFGPTLTWLLGLPCWLLGCILAERYEAIRRMIVSVPAIWTWRFIMWALAWTCSLLKFHSPIGYPITLNLFSIVVFFWLKREIAFYQVNRPSRLLERAGVWSYSVYLTHLHAQSIYLLLGIMLLVFPFGWIVHLLFLLCVCYAFYLLVEAPSHFIARRLAKLIGKRVATENFPEPMVLSIMPDRVAD